MQSIAGSRDTGDFPCPCNQQKVKVLQPSLSKIRQNNHNLHLPLKAHHAKQIWCPPARKQAISKIILFDHQNFTYSLVFEPYVAQMNLLTIVTKSYWRDTVCENKTNTSYKDSWELAEW